MGTCASKPKVLNGDAPEVSPENIIANNEDTGVVVKEEVVNKEEIVNNDNVDNTPSLNNALEVCIHISMPNLYIFLFFLILCLPSYFYLRYQFIVRALDVIKVCM